MYNKRTLLLLLPPPRLPPTLASRGRLARVFSRNWLPGPRFPGTRKGEGDSGGNNWAAAGETRGQERQDSEGAVSPGCAATRLAGGAPPTAADWWILKFGLKAPEVV